MMTPSEPQQPPEDAPERAEPPKTLHEAILRVQGELPKLTKAETARVQSKKGSGASYTYRYIGLDGVMEKVLPVLNHNGLVWITMPVHSPEGAMLDYQLVFAADPEQAISGSVRLPVGDADAQAIGSAITYFRRYALLAVLGLAPDEDDDGEAAKKGQREAQQRQQDARNAARPMTPEELERMQEAVRVAGGDLADLTAQAGVGEGETPTIGQGRRIKELLAG